jgi:Protein of unknown function (DUF3099)
MVGGGGDVKDPERTDAPILITEAPMSYADELATRKRRYAIMMAMRIPALVLAALCYQTPWLAVLIILASVPLPWMAVLIANDRLPNKVAKFRRFRGSPRELEAHTHPVVQPGPPA